LRAFWRSRSRPRRFFAGPTGQVLARGERGLLDDMRDAPPSYAHGSSSTPLLGDTIGENLRRTVERFPEREALVVASPGFRASYRQLWDFTTEIARGLLAHGVAPGDRVGIWSPNRYEWVVVQYATARIGAILVNINPAYKTAELEYALNQSGTSVLLLARAFRQNDYLRMLDEASAPARSRPSRSPATGNSSASSPPR